MKKFIIIILFFGIIVLLGWGMFTFSNYQMRGLKQFKGYTIEECQQYYNNFTVND